MNDVVKDWFVSSATGAEGNCVEVRFREGGFVDVRNSNDREAGTVTFNQGEWNAFMVGAKKNEFDLPN
ncbi:hypothetical protein GCM10010423_64700 [Streptomyces levis]|uniref:DUF397 domain-containing protein n=1 Tax=Streptomyces levis TaxID=285566 RepID=A0ABN3P2B7_9ACTN